jgi:nitrate reductase beta subunit
MLFYVPPLIPVVGRMGDDVYSHDVDKIFAKVEQARLPLKYMASLFSAGNLDIVKDVIRRLTAVRYTMRAKELKDVEESYINKLLIKTGLTPEIVQSIYQLTATSTVKDRYVFPPLHREQGPAAKIDGIETCKGTCGFGGNKPMKRGL